MKNRIVFVIGGDLAIHKACSRLGLNEGFTTITFAQPAEFVHWVRHDGRDCLPSLAASCCIAESRCWMLQSAWHSIDEIRHIPIICIGLPETVSVTTQLLHTFRGFCLEKPFSLKELNETIHLAFERYMKNVQSKQAENTISDLFGRLTKREHDVGTLVACGLTNQEIANGLKISIKTVKAHRAKVMKKTGSESLADLVRNFEKYSTLAIKTGHH